MIGYSNYWCITRGLYTDFTNESPGCGLYTSAGNTLVITVITEYNTDSYQVKIRLKIDWIFPYICVIDFKDRIFTLFTKHKSWHVGPTGRSRIVMNTHSFLCMYTYVIWNLKLLLSNYMALTLPCRFRMRDICWWSSASDTSAPGSCLRHDSRFHSGF